jgi:pimeloyl-ACP methyl ester carboxylesterase
MLTELIALVLITHCSAPENSTPYCPPLFSSDEGREIYLERYERIVSKWTAAREDVYAETSFGLTHMIFHPNPGRPSLVLLHAAGLGAVSWYANFDASAAHFQLLAVDTPGDAGRSELYASNLTTDAYNSWLIELLDHFDLPQAIFCGHSIGGFIAVNVAIAAPHRIEKLILLAPAATFENFRWYVKLGLERGGTAGIGPKAVTILRLQAHRGFVMNSDFVDMVSVVRDCCCVRMIFPYRLTDEELGRVSTPTLLLLPEDEVIYNPIRASERAERLLPVVTIEIITECGHTINMEQPHEVNRRIIDFCMPE